MSDPFSWIGAGLSAGSNLLGGIFGAQATDRASKRAYRLGRDNLALQAEEQAYQRQFAAEGRAREDNAVQRRAADMAAAGFNPLLAAGSPAASGVTSGSSAPQMDAGDSFRLQAEAGRQRGQAIAKAGVFPAQLLSMEMMKAQINKINAEADATRVSSGAISTKLPYEISSMQADTALKGGQLDNIRFDLEKMKPAQISSINSQIAKVSQDIAHSSWAMKNGDTLTALQRARDANEQTFRQAGLSESTARLAAEAVKLEQLKLELQRSRDTYGASVAREYNQMLRDMDMVKTLAARFGMPDLFSKLSRLIKEASK